MTPNPTAMRADAPVTAAARAMRDLDIGAVVVVEDDQPLGIVTDRDIVVRALAEPPPRVRPPSETSAAGRSPPSPPA